MLEQCMVLFTPDDIMGWYNKLIAKKYDGSQHRTSLGRQPLSREITDLLIRFKKEHPH